jgi:3-oxoadipate enol-lactonase
MVDGGRKPAGGVWVTAGRIAGMETMIAVDGGKLWVEDSGGAGTPVVLLHPGVGDSTIWDPIMPRLTAGYRVIRYDARGWGRSPAATVPFALVDDLIAVLDRLDVPRATFVGCSQGGAASLELALLQPERVAALVLVTPGVTGYQWPDDPEVNAAFEEFAEAGDLDGIAEVGLGIWAAAGRDDAVVAQLRSAASAWLHNGDNERERVGAFNRLGELTMPSVLMIGEADRPALVECNIQMAERIPGCRRIDVPGGDHLLPLRVPDLIATTIEEYAV